MSLLSSIVMVLVGLVLLFAGAALSVYGVALLGIVLGGAIGYLAAPTIAGLAGIEGVAGLVLAVGAGAAIGLVVAYLALSFAVAVASLIVGTFLAIVAVIPVVLPEAAWYVEWPAAIGVGLALGFVGLVMTKSVLILVTSAVGALLASQQINLSELATAGAEVSLEAVTVDATAPLFVGLFVLGILSQFGLFKLGYVARIHRIVPGYQRVTDRGERA